MRGFVNYSRQVLAPKLPNSDDSLIMLRWQHTVYITRKNSYHYSKLSVPFFVRTGII